MLPSDAYEHQVEHYHKQVREAELWHAARLDPRYEPTAYLGFASLRRYLRLVSHKLGQARLAVIRRITAGRSNALPERNGEELSPFSPG